MGRASAGCDGRSAGAGCCGMTIDALHSPGDAMTESAAAIGENPWRRAWRRLAQRRAALFGLGVIVLFVTIALAAPLLSPYDPVATDWLAVRKPPSLQHLFGTDEIGRDVLSRIIWGTRASLLAGIVSVTIALAL